MLAIPNHRNRRGRLLSKSPMTRLIIFALALTLTAIAAAELQRTVDLREPGALRALETSNPAHFARIRRALVALEERPDRAEGDWLEVNIDASDVNLSKLLFKTSNPPKQLLQFTLDDTRYLMHLVRRDINADAMPAR